VVIRHLWQIKTIVFLQRWLLGAVLLGQFLPLGGTMVTGYAFQLLFSEIANNSATTKARRKISSYLESLEF
jgi:hypothetical protein